MGRVEVYLNQMFKVCFKDFSMNILGNDELSVITDDGMSLIF